MRGAIKKSFIKSAIKLESYGSLKSLVLLSMGILKLAKLLQNGRFCEQLSIRFVHKFSDFFHYLSKCVLPPSDLNICHGKIYFTPHMSRSEGHNKKYEK